MRHGVCVERARGARKEKACAHVNKKKKFKTSCKIDDWFLGLRSFMVRLSVPNLWMPEVSDDYFSEIETLYSEILLQVKYTQSLL